MVVLVVSTLLVPLMGCGDDDEAAPPGPFTWSVRQDGTGDYGSIQACINGAGPLDTCLVAAGTYYERIRYNGKAVKVVSAGGPDATVIDGELEGSVVRFLDQEDEDSTLVGFTVRNGHAVPPDPETEAEEIEHGGGIQIIAASPTIQGCIIRDNQADGNGGGIYCFATGAGPRIEDTILYGNTAAGQGGGLYALSSNPELLDCLLAGNEAATGGAVSARLGASVLVQSSTLADNTATATAGALYLEDSRSSWSYAICWGNAAPAGPSILATDRPGTGSATSLSLVSVDLEGGIDALTWQGGCTGDPSPCLALGFNVFGAGPDDEPLFVPYDLDDPQPEQAYYLSNTATARADQDRDSPCLRAALDAEGASVQAASVGLETRTTRTDDEPNVGTLDLGFHYEPGGG